MNLRLQPCEGCTLPLSYAPDLAGTLPRTFGIGNAPFGAWPRKLGRDRRARGHAPPSLAVRVKPGAAAVVAGFCRGGWAHQHRGPDDPAMTRPQPSAVEYNVRAPAERPACAARPSAARRIDPSCSCLGARCGPASPARTSRSPALMPRRRAPSRVRAEWGLHLSNQLRNHRLCWLGMRTFGQERAAAQRSGGGGHSVGCRAGSVSWPGPRWRVGLMGGFCGAVRG